MNDLIETACHNAWQAMHRDAAGWLLGQLSAQVIPLRPGRGGVA